MPGSIEDILKRATPRERTVKVCIRGDLAGRVQSLTEELAKVSKEWEPSDITEVHPARQIAADLKAARDEAQAAEVPFTVRYIGDRAYSDLLAAHPSDDENELFKLETFTPALIAASCADPVMTLAQTKELFEVINEGEIKKLFDAAWDVHHSSDVVPFSLAASAFLAVLGGES
ncbi:hypothetical protein MBT42_00195 [Streptomyces sp. MBT42]|uniref:hypothetical protein n=1 Tax=Streptomyces sp. MBT42 TaxID=1488373 RepID=UPI001E60AFFB|nr:hypothetical protein [Streptomyces sp. MBT42]MCD2461978.1 hypothetical protein [Streptomyces sp. MBT42]